MKSIETCPVCGSDGFTDNEVLWPELIDEWALKKNEVEYINRQQGFSCVVCGNNLRSMALAYTILRSYEYQGTLKQFVLEGSSKDIKLLEINNAGALTHVFEKLNGHKLTTYPEYDIENLCIDTSSYDLVVHSDTLEHIKNPVVALSECNRVLKPSGKCIFTVPIIVDRVSKSRSGLVDSYHGNSDSNSGDLVVHTEFGCDVWKYVIEAGFSAVTLHSVEYPAGLAIEATS